MNLHEMQEEDSFWRLGLCPSVQDIDTVLTNRFGGNNNNTLSLLCCDVYMRRRQFKESLKQTMLEQASVFEDQIHELHRLYQKQKKLMIEIERGSNNNTCFSSNMSKIEDESVEKKVLVLDLEEEEVHETGLSKLDLNQPAKIKEHSLNPAQTKSERSETESQEEIGINLNAYPLLSSEEEEEVITFKKIESEQPRDTLRGKEETEPFREIVQALPCSKSVSLYHKRSSSWPRKRRNSNVDCFSSLHWFAKIVSSVVEDSKSGEVGLSVTESHSDYYQRDSFEEKTTKGRKNTLASNIVKHKRTRRRRGKQQQTQREDHRNKANDARSSYFGLLENTVIDWGTVRKRRRSNRVPSIAFSSNRRK